jgi:hypothetical protein
MFIEYQLAFGIETADGQESPTFDQILERIPLVLAKLESQFASSDSEVRFTGLKIVDWSYPQLRK